MEGIVEFLMKMKDGMSGPLDKIIAKTEKTGRVFDQVTSQTEKAVHKTSKSIKQLKDELASLRKTRDLLPVDSEKQLTRINRKIKEVEGSLRRARKAGTGGVSSAGSGGFSAFNLGRVLPAALLTSLATRAFGFSIEKGAERDYKRRQFQNDFGTAKGAQLFIALGTQRSSLGEGVFDNGKALVESGFRIDEVTGLLRKLGDVANGSDKKLSSLSETFGEINKKGHLTRETMKDLNDKGFKPLNIMYEKTGEGFDSLFSRLDAGKITIQEVQSALETATTKGGEFFGNLDRLDESALKRWDRLKDSIVTIASNFSENLLGAFNIGDKNREPLSIFDKAKLRSQVGGSPLDAILGMFGSPELNNISKPPMTTNSFGIPIIQPGIAFPTIQDHIDKANGKFSKDMKTHGRPLHNSARIESERLRKLEEEKQAQNKKNKNQNNIHDRINAVNGGGVRNVTISIGKMIETINNKFENGGRKEANDMTRVVREQLVRILADVATS